MQALIDALRHAGVAAEDIQIQALNLQLERIAALLEAQDAKHPKYTSIYISFLYLDL
jgi:hypothetical protein